MIKKVALLASHVGASLRSSWGRYIKSGINSNKVAEDCGFVKPEVPWYKRPIANWKIRINTARLVRGPAFVSKFPSFDASRQSKRAALFSIAFAERTLRHPLEARRDRRRKARIASHIAFLTMQSASRVR
jgi:hypothetical protein